MKKRTIQVSVWSDNDERVAEFVNGVRLLAQAAFSVDNQSVVFTGIGVKKLRAAVEDLDWRSANVRGRMTLNE